MCPLTAQSEGSASASMDSPTTLDSNSATSAAERYLRSGNPNRPALASVSAGIAAANLLLTLPADGTPRFPGEDEGRSLAEIARRDLDAALQLLADRAQYITGASGAAIALRRGQHADMLCRASSGLNAPELGALLSMEYGLSGESVRTGRALRCDDAAHDPRVNQEGCRQLGIASVVIMPIMSERQVFGVFELFSGKPHAFDERDVSALQRLGEMVEVAVRHAVAAQGIPALPQVPVSASNRQEARVGEQAPAAATPRPGSQTQPVRTNAAPVVSSAGPPLQERPLEKEFKAQPDSQKPLFWSAALRAQGAAGRPTGEAKETAAESLAVPPVLRRLEKCQVCGFPVSPGRTFCVECEEKHWRAQRLSQAGARDSRQSQAQRPPETRGTVQVSDVPEPSGSTITIPSRSAAAALSAEPAGPAPAIAVTTIHVRRAAPIAALSLPAQTSADSTPEASTELAAADEESAPFLSSVTQPQSWLAANKYIVGALLVIAIV